jgi:hypothetical protein
MRARESKETEDARKRLKSLRTKSEPSASSLKKHLTLHQQLFTPTEEPVVESSTRTGDNSSFQQSVMPCKSLRLVKKGAAFRA